MANERRTKMSNGMTKITGTDTEGNQYTNYRVPVHYNHQERTWVSDSVYNGMDNKIFVEMQDGSTKSLHQLGQENE